MKTKDETQTLKEMILAEELKHIDDLKELKEQFYIAYKSVKPINLVKKLFEEVTTLPEIKNNVLNNAIGLASGLLIKIILVGTVNNPIKKVLGTALEFALATIVSKHSEKIKLIGGNLIRNFKNRLAFKKKQPFY